MNFKDFIESNASNPIKSLHHALQILGLKPNATEQDIKKQHRTLSRSAHPDSPTGSKEQQQLINNAYDFLKDLDFNTSQGLYPPHYRPGPSDWRDPVQPDPRPQPPWQTDERSTYNEVGKDFTNLNFCKKSIYDKAMENGGNVKKFTLYAFDGNYFRGVFSAFCNYKTLGYAGMVMDKWNSTGANSYKTNAVFSTLPGIAETMMRKLLWLVRLYGHDVADKDEYLTHDSFNNNPGNDNDFVNSLTEKLDELAAKWGID